MKQSSGNDNKILTRLGMKKTEWAPPDTSFDVLYENLIKSNDPVIIDVGSHRGESIDRFRRLWPQCTIECYLEGPYANNI